MMASTCTVTESFVRILKITETINYDSSSERQMTERQTTEHQMTERRTTGRQMTERQTTEHQTTE